MEEVRDARDNVRNPGMVIVLNGFPGTGKYTILRNLQEQIEYPAVHLIDNQLLYDPVHAIYPTYNSSHCHLRQHIRDIYFASIRQIIGEGHIVLMTTCLGDSTDDEQVMIEHLNLIRGTGNYLFWISVECDQDILEERLTSFERVLTPKCKLTDLAILRGLQSQYQMISPLASDDVQEIMRGHKLVTSFLDVSGSVRQSVDNIFSMIGEIDTILVTAAQ